MEEEPTIACCFPFSVIQKIECHKLSLIIIIYDLLLFFGWFIYNISSVENITIAPGLINFICILFFFFLIWDLRSPEGPFFFVQYYRYIRFFFAALISVICMIFFIMVFVYLSNSSLETPALNAVWCGLYLLFLVPGAVIMWGSCITFTKIIEILNSGVVIQERKRIDSASVDLNSSRLGGSKVVKLSFK